MKIALLNKLDGSAKRLSLFQVVYNFPINYHVSLVIVNNDRDGQYRLILSTPVPAQNKCDRGDHDTP